MSSNPYAKRSQMAPTARSVRAYAAPINRVTGAIVAFDPAQGPFNLDLPPAPWIHLAGSKTSSAPPRPGTTHSVPAPLPASRFSTAPSPRPAWSSTFLLGASCDGALWWHPATERSRRAARILPQPSGGMPLPASPLQTGSTYSQIVLASDQLANFSVGDIVAVDVDYNGQTGYLGSGAAGAYLASPLNGQQYFDFVRRITFNVANRCHHVIGAATSRTADRASNYQHERSEGRRFRRSRRQQFLPGTVWVVDCRAG